MRRALVTLPDGVWKVIDKQLKGVLGDGDSEVIRNVVIAHLTEKGYLLAPRRAKGLASSSETKELKGEVDMQDKMITSLVELLEEKGQLNYSDWESRIRKKIAGKVSSTTK